VSFAFQVRWDVSCWIAWAALYSPFYILLVGSAAFAIVSFAVSVTDQASATPPRHLSRAEAQIQSAEGSAKRPPVTSELLVPSASKISAGGLAGGLDEAEGHFPRYRKSRLARSHPRSRIAKETTRRIILRSLFAQNERP
jgi:hypothetical protein